MDDATIASAAAAVQLVMAVALLALAGRSALRTRSPRMLWLAGAFAAFTVQAGLLALALLTSAIPLIAATAYGAAVGAAGLLAIYVGLLRP